MRIIKNSKNKYIIGFLFLFATLFLISENTTINSSLENIRGPDHNDDIMEELTDPNNLKSSNYSIQWDINGIPVATTITEKYEVQVLGDGAGGMFIVWRNNAGNPSDIYAQYIDAGGTSLWTANGTIICNAANGQTSPKMIADGTGGIIIVWSDYRNDGSNGDIYAQRVNSSGAALWSANGEVISNVGLNLRRPEVVGDGVGGIIIVWEDWDGNQGDIYSQRVDENGTSLWTGNGILIANFDGGSTPKRDQSLPKITTDGDKGAIITWQDRRSGKYDIYAQRINSTGSTLWDANGTVISNSSGTHEFSTITTDASQGAIITWADNSDSGDWNIYAQRINAMGSTLWKANGTVISNATNIQWKPALISDDSGGAFIAWEDYRDDASGDVYVQWINSSGITQWTPNGTVISNAGNAQINIQITRNSQEDTFICWQDQRSGNKIYMQVINSTGGIQLAPNGEAIAGAGTSQIDPVIALDGLNGTVIAWKDVIGGIPEEMHVYAQRFGIPFPGPFTLSSDATSPELDGHFTLNWADSLNADNYTVYQFDHYISEINNTLIKLLDETTQKSLILDLPNGTYYFITVASNELANISSNVIMVSVIIDFPYINITSPSQYSFHSYTAPNFTITNLKGGLHTSWYSIYNNSLWSQNITFTGNNTKINQAIWNSSILEGLLTLRVYANGSVGGINYTDVILNIDLTHPTINIELPLTGSHSLAPIFIIEVNETNIDVMYYSFDGGVSKHYFTGASGEINAQIDSALWNSLPVGSYYLSFFIVDKYGYNASDAVYIIKVLPDDDDDSDKESPDEGLPFWLQAILYGTISSLVGVAFKIGYSKIKKRKIRESRRLEIEKLEERSTVAATTAAIAAVQGSKKYVIEHLDLLTPFNKVERSTFKVGVAQIGVSTTGNLMTELYYMDENHLMRIKPDKINDVLENIKDKLEIAKQNGVDIILFPEMSTDLNYEEMLKTIYEYAEKYKMYIITGGYHDVETKRNICLVIGPGGIHWMQEKHNPATIHFGKSAFTEAIHITDPPHKVKVVQTEFGRIAIGICRDFLDMDLRVELKNSEPPVDLVFNPAYSPVTSDFDAIHFDVRRSVYAYTFYTNVAEYGGAVIYSPEKDRTERKLGPKQEGVIFKEVKLMKLRSARRKWERARKKERGFIQSTRQ